VATNLPFDRIGVNLLGGCGRVVGGAMLCWGATYPDGQYAPGPTPYPRHIHGGTPAENSMMPCATDPTGGAWCWEVFPAWIDAPASFDVQRFETRSMPAVASRAGPWRDLAFSDNALCAIDRPGVAWCVGANDKAQHGVGFIDTGFGPARPVNSTLRFRAIGGGNGYFCGISTADGVACWGLNNLSQVDPDTTRTIITAPQLVAGLPPIRKLALSPSTPCALDTQGRPWCWGTYAGGRPRDLGWPFALTDLAASDFSVCGLAMDGQTWCGPLTLPPQRLPPPER
jgi:hypothetical protein